MDDNKKLFDEDLFRKVSEGVKSVFYNNNLQDINNEVYLSFDVRSKDIILSSDVLLFNFAHDNNLKILYCFLSFKMNGKSMEEINDTYCRMTSLIIYNFDKIKNINDYDAIIFVSNKNTQFPDYLEDTVKNKRVWYLGTALKKLAKCDIVVFDEDWETSNGCISERRISRLYRIESYFCDYTTKSICNSDEYIKKKLHINDKYSTTEYFMNHLLPKEKMMQYISDEDYNELFDTSESIAYNVTQAGFTTNKEEITNTINALHKLENLLYKIQSISNKNENKETNNE